jgi:hypothetical protein
VKAKIPRYVVADQDVALCSSHFHVLDSDLFFEFSLNVSTNSNSAWHAWLSTSDQAN